MEQQPLETQETPSALTVGAQLSAAREAAGLSLGEVADRLKLSVKQLDALEKDDYERLPGGVFVRGFVRSYARFLNLDDVPLLQAIEHQFPSVAAATGTAALEASKTSNTESTSILNSTDSTSGLAIGKGPILLLILVIAAGTAWYFWKQSAASSTQTSQGLQPMLTHQEAEASQAIEQPEASEDTAGGVEVSTDASSQAAIALTSSQPGISSLVLTVKAEQSWVSVRDAEGKMLVSETLGAGASRSVQGKTPFKVTLGNAPQVSVNLNGQPVDFKEKIQRGNTAKLELK